MEEHQHTNKIVKVKAPEDSQYLWVEHFACSKCDVEPQPERFEYPEEVIDHSKCDYDPCFGCKVRGIQIGLGDANSKNGMTKKKWDAELNAYSKARSQGIQPAGTTMAAVQDAFKKSDAAGKAYDANTGGFK
jgi:hypothetical protein